MNRRRLATASAIAAVLSMLATTVAHSATVEVLQFGSHGTDIGGDVVAMPDGGTVVSGGSFEPMDNGGRRGDFDAFVRRYDAAGNVMWTTTSGTIGQDKLLGLTTGPGGAIYAAGGAGGIAGIRLPAGSNKPAGGDYQAFLPFREISVHRYSPNGALVWQRTIGGLLFDEAIGIAHTTAGEIVVAGLARSTIGLGLPLGLGQLVVVGLSPDGRQRWTVLTGRLLAFSSALDAVAHPAGGVLIVGQRNTNALSGGGGEAVVLRLSNTGKVLWERVLDTPGYDEIVSAAVATDGSIYLAGDTDGRFPGQVAHGGYDAIVAKLTPTGAPVWIRQFGTPGEDDGFGIGIDSTGGVHVTGERGGDGFLVTYDSAGNLLRDIVIGTTGYDYGSRLAVQADDSVVILGETDGRFPGEDRFGGFTDLFLATVSP